MYGGPWKERKKNTDQIFPAPPTPFQPQKNTPAAIYFAPRSHGPLRSLTLRGMFYSAPRPSTCRLIDTRPFSANVHRSQVYGYRGIEGGGGGTGETS